MVAPSRGRFINAIDLNRVSLQFDKTDGHHPGYINNLTLSKAVR
jgi:hypothetical protein